MNGSNVSMGNFVQGTPEYSREQYRRRKEAQENDSNRFLVHLYRTTKNEAPRRNINFALDLIDLALVIEFQNWICARSGRKLSMKTGDPDRASIDRIDNNRGYEISNIQIVTGEYNYMKNDMSQDQTDTLIRDCYKQLPKIK